MKETFRKDYELFCSDKIRQTNKSLICCVYKNEIIKYIYFCLPCSNGGMSLELLLVLWEIIGSLPPVSNIVIKFPVEL